MKRAALLVTLTAFTTAPAYAEISVKAYKLARTDSEMRTYVLGVGRGIEWANASLPGGRAIYCPPPHMVFNQGNFIDLIDRAIKDPATKDTDQIEVLLLTGLINDFPCKER
jgi:hypothetical protein